MWSSQGSVLGPLLFLIYVNDLGNSLSNSAHYLYADDTVIFKSGPNIQAIVPQLQNDLNDFGKWCEGNKLTINTKKSNYVVYGTNQKVARVNQCELRLQNDVLFKTIGYKYLGVYIDSHLNYNTHIDNCVKIVSHKLYLLSKIRQHIPESTCVKIYNTMIVPLLYYGDIIYSGTTDKNLSRLQKLQNRGLRICLNTQGYISRIQLHLSCKVFPLKRRRKINLRKYMYKQKENQDIVVNRNIRTRRHDAVVFEMCKPNLELVKKSTMYRGIQDWNDLPANVRNIDNFNEFKILQKLNFSDQLPFVSNTHF